MRLFYFVFQLFWCLILVTIFADGFESRSPKMIFRLRTCMTMTADAQTPSPPSSPFNFDSFFKSLSNFKFLNEDVDLLNKEVKAREKIDEKEKKTQQEKIQLLNDCNEKIIFNKDILIKASTKSFDDKDQIVQSLEDLEKLMREKNKLDGGQTANETLQYLDGTWRLIFTTGTASTQKKIGRINYFPLKAEQSFNTTDFTISNGIFIGNYPALKFFGNFEWKPKPRKLEFDFDTIQVFGLKINLPKGKAADLGKATGLGSENNVDLVKKGNKPFFNWISADEVIATARGGGGGLALWKRVQ